MAATKICSVEGCGKAGKLTRGWCPKHYRRWQVHGDPLISLYDREQTGQPCKHDGCDKPSGYQGFCQNHYKMWRARGSTDHHQRFRRRISWIESNAQWASDECLIWPFGVNDTGRGQMAFRGRVTSAPRVMCTIAHGDPPTPEHEAAHSCGKGHMGCVSPVHLRWATHAENEADKVDHGTHRRGEKINTAKLTEPDVREIRARPSDAGVALALEFGVTPSAISAIRTGRAWSWLD